MSQQSPRVICDRPMLAIENPCSVAGCIHPRDGRATRCKYHREKDQRQSIDRRRLAAEKRAHPERFEKACNRCGASKKLTEFYANKKHSDGRQGHCKVCERKKAPPSRVVATGDLCPKCCGLSHQRPRVGLCACGESFREEDMAAVRAQHLDGRRGAV